MPPKQQSKAKVPQAPSRGANPTASAHMHKKANGVAKKAAANERGLKLTKKATDQLIQSAVDGDLETLRSLLLRVLGDSEVQQETSGTTHVDDVTKKGRTLFLIAVANGHLPCAEFLLSKGADIEKPETSTAAHFRALHIAAGKGDIGMTTFLLTHGAKINSRDSNQATALAIAVEQNNRELVQLLLSHDANPQIRDHQGSDALLVATKNGHAELVNLFLSHGLDVETRDGQGSTPLLVAAKHGHVGLCLRFLSLGADVLARNFTADCALVLAAGKNHTNCVSLLLTHGASRKINLKDHRGDPAIVLAAEHGNCKMLHDLLDNGAAIEAEGVSAKTALIRASKSGNVDAVAMLLARGANVEAESRDCYTALLEASALGFKDIVVMLAEKRSDLEARCKPDGMTALMLAATNKHPEVLAQLISYGANVKAVSNTGNTALSLAASKGDEEGLKVLMLHGAGISVNTVGPNQNTALMRAVMGGFASVVEMLFAHKADVHAKNVDGNNALMLAAERGHVDIAKILLSNGANVNTTNAANFTALLYAAKGPKEYKEDKGMPEMQALLLNHGADPNVAIHEDDMTPLHFALRRKQFDLLDLLLSRGAKSDVKNKNGITAWQLAVESTLQSGGHFPENAMQLLLTHGANLNAVFTSTMDYQYTPTTALLLAVKFHHKAVVSMLLKHGADMEAIEVDIAYFDTPLYTAVNRSNPDLNIITMLLEHGANTEALCGYSKTTALWIACERRLDEIMALLISHRANVNATDCDGQSMLMLVSENLYYDNAHKMMSLLLTNGANVDTEKNYFLHRTAIGIVLNRYSNYHSFAYGESKSLEMLLVASLKSGKAAAAEAARIGVHQQLLDRPAVQRELHWNVRRNFLSLVESCNEESRTEAQVVPTAPAATVNSGSLRRGNRAVNINTRFRTASVGTTDRLVPLTSVTATSNRDHILRYLFNEYLVWDICSYMVVPDYRKQGVAPLAAHVPVAAAYHHDPYIDYGPVLHEDYNSFDDDLENGDGDY